MKDLNSTYSHQVKSTAAVDVYSLIKLIKPKQFQNNPRELKQIIHPKALLHANSFE